MRQNHNGFYSKEKYYDVAFNCKNVKEENQTILNVYQRIQGVAAKSVGVELKYLQGDMRSFKMNEPVEVIGSLKSNVKFSNEKTCWRMIPDLRKLDV